MIVPGPAALDVKSPSLLVYNSELGLEEQQTPFAKLALGKFCRDHNFRRIFRCSAWRFNTSLPHSQHIEQILIPGCCLVVLGQHPRYTVVPWLENITHKLSGKISQDGDSRCSRHAGSPQQWASKTSEEAENCGEAPRSVVLCVDKSSH